LTKAQAKCKKENSMTERLKDGQIVGLVAKEDPVPQTKLDINLVRVSNDENNINLRFPVDKWLTDTPYTPTDAVGIQHTFPELVTEIISLKVKPIEKQEESSNLSVEKPTTKSDENSKVLTGRQLAFSQFSMR
jgi:hypothetical protein